MIDDCSIYFERKLIHTWTHDHIEGKVFFVQFFFFNLAIKSKKMTVQIKECSASVVMGNL